MTDWQEIRERAGVSRARVAVAAGVSEPTALKFELNPDSVRSYQKREALTREYERLRAQVHNRTGV